MLNGHAQEHVRGTLVDLHRQFAVGDVELEAHVARHEGHLVQLGDDVATRLEILREQAESALNLG